MLYWSVKSNNFILQSKTMGNIKYLAMWQAQGSRPKSGSLSSIISYWFAAVLLLPETGGFRIICSYRSRSCERFPEISLSQVPLSFFLAYFNQHLPHFYAEVELRAQGLLSFYYSNNRWYSAMNAEKMELLRKSRMYEKSYSFFIRGVWEL